VAFDVLAGNAADSAALTSTIARFRERFRIRRAIVVADRGMLGRATLALLRDHATAPFDHIRGCPLRRERAVAKEVLARPSRYQPVADNLEVKEVRLGERRGARPRAGAAGPGGGPPQPARGPAGRRRPRPPSPPARSDKDSAHGLTG
jgi:hypothetical protein